MLRPDGETTDLELLGDLRPMDVLVEFDGPKLFVAQSPGHDLLLAYQVTDERDGQQVVVVPTTARTLNALRDGLPLRDALFAGDRSWLVDLRDGHPTRAQTVDLALLPVERLPRHGARIPSEWNARSIHLNMSVPEAHLLSLAVAQAMVLRSRAPLRRFQVSREAAAGG